MDAILQNGKKLLEKGDHYLASALSALKQKEPIGLFGAGDLGVRMKKMFEAHGVSVAFFTDNDTNKWGREIDGLFILSPAEAAKQSGVFFVACSADALVMAEQLRQLGVPQCDTKLYLACRALFHSRDLFVHHRADLTRLYEILEDHTSRATLQRLVLHAYTLDAAHIEKAQSRAQYFFSAEFAVRSGETVVDAGAYIGDTVRDMIARFGANFRKVHCFEPNRDSFAHLREYIAQTGLTGRVIPHRLGLSDKKGTIHFSGSGVGFCKDQKGGARGVTVKTDTLDNLFARRPPQRIDFIKMDIEGAEPLALQGGAQVITRDRPRLAICVYHSPEHLWTIPLYIKSLVPEYRLFLRHHSASTRETVLYASV